jgi:pimeloyl-ACP methyl ester carboxylesterase
MVDGKISHRPFYLSIPDNEMARDPDKKLPMIVFLHGIAEGGDDHTRLFVEAIPVYCRDKLEFKRNLPFVFLCPQAPDGRFWDSKDMPEFVVGLIQMAIEKYGVDPDRVYLTGLSSGGSGVWRIAEDHPDLFAAIAPISGRAVDPKHAGEKLKNVPAWMAVGGDDSDFVIAAHQMMTSLKNAGDEVRLKVVPGFQHVIWDQAFLDPKLYQWLLAHRRGSKDLIATTMPANSPRRTAIALLKEADTARAAGQPVEAYRKYKSIVLSCPDTPAGKAAEEAVARYEADANFAAEYKKAQDEESAAEMLRIGYEYQVNDKTPQAKDAFTQCAKVWPLTEAAAEANRALAKMK